MSRRVPIDDLARGVRAGERTRLAQAITLIESASISHEADAQELLRRLLPGTGKARRIGVTGVPGVGKSTLIERFGTMLIDRGHRVAVLAIDPSSRRTGGSILGDKTRMAELSRREEAFIRPSPSAGSLGGVARRTRESMLLCEAAGYDVVIVETVGVGQSETAVADMVDFFLLLMLPRSGDELQGIKRGILELADVIAVNKADGDALPAARRTARAFESALRLMRPALRAWQPSVVLTSALEGDGVEALWSQVTAFHRRTEESGELAEKRSRQLLEWMWSAIDDALLRSLRAHPRVRERLVSLEREVVEGRTTPGMAAQELLSYGAPGAKGEGA